MSETIPNYLHLPSKDRSFWNGIDKGMPLLYLAWGRRNFKEEGIPVSRHEGWVVCLMLEGNATLLLESESIKVSKGQLVFIGPDCANGWSAERNSECRFILWMWDDLPGFTGIEKLRTSYLISNIAVKDRDPYIQLHDSCRREVLKIDSQSEMFMTGCRMMLQSLIERSQQQAGDKEFDSVRYKIALQWFKEHLDSKQPIARICDYLNISQPSLYRLFRSQSDQSPQDCFKKLKMEHAKELITTTDMTIKEIAFQLGYDHFNDFSRAIKSYFKCSARELKAKSKSK